jgi:hypothetical protein
MNKTILRIAFAGLVVALPLLLSACGNRYQSPENGAPTTWGEQHYVDVQEYHQTIENHRHRR